MYIVDRFEGKIAVCEDETKKVILIPREELPSEVKEGDCIRCEETRYVIDVEATKQRRDNIRKLMDQLFE